MKKFITPEMTISKFMDENVVTVSVYNMTMEDFETQTAGYTTGTYSYENLNVTF